MILSCNEQKKPCNAPKACDVSVWTKTVSCFKEATKMARFPNLLKTMRWTNQWSLHLAATFHGQCHVAVVPRVQLNTVPLLYRIGTY